jgi:hypothetical protein
LEQADNEREADAVQTVDLAQGNVLLVNGGRDSRTTIDRIGTLGDFRKRLPSGG